MDEWKGNDKDNNLFQITGIAILTNLPSNEQLKSKLAGRVRRLLASEIGHHTSALLEQHQ